MNTKNNSRKRSSVERIEKAFLDLLQTKELHKISVSELCKACDLNRSTFYANYIDIYDLADKIREQLEENVNKLFEEERAVKFNSNDYLKLFKHINSNQSIYRTYFKLGYDNQFEINTYDTKQAQQHFNNQNIDYHIEFFRSGLNAIIKKWLYNGCKESPEEMEQIIKSEYNGREQ